MPTLPPAILVETRVSIRTRPTGRVMREIFRLDNVYSQSFNPHPANRPGDASIAWIGNRDAGVSIRTRPTGRVMLSGQRQARGFGMFQSAPGQPAG